MSDYMFVLDSHLDGEQSKVLALVRDAAEQSNLNLFLAGGAMRDMMAGYPIRDLDFVIEGASGKFAKSLTQSAGALITSSDDLRKSVELSFPSGVTASISMAHQERYPKPGARPQVIPATIHDDLRCRDFTINAVALSLGKASRGLLLDPTNGLGDLANRELRAISNHGLYDDPSRILRLLRLRTRLGFTVDERTMTQYEGVRQAGLEARIPQETLLREISAIAFEPNPGDALRALAEADLLRIFSPALGGSKLDLSGFAKLQKARQLLPFGATIPVDSLKLFLLLLLQKMSSRERASFVQSVGLDKAVVDVALKLESKANKVEAEIAKVRITRPSVGYATLSKVPGELLLLVLMRSSQRVVLERIKNYLQKYLPIAMEVREEDVVRASSATPGSPQYAQARQKLINVRLDTRPKKVVVEEPPPAPPPPVQGPGRRSAPTVRTNA